MARAEYLWVVIDVSFLRPSFPVNVFTVKHELLDWWGKVPDQKKRVYSVARMRDGGAMRYSSDIGSDFLIVDIAVEYGKTNHDFKPQAIHVGDPCCDYCGFGQDHPRHT